MIKAKRWRHLIALCLLFTNQPSFAVDEAYYAETLSPYEAFLQGRLLRARFKQNEAMLLLKSAAERGSAEAAYLYAIEQKNIHYSETVQQYLEMSANKGHLAAMQYLYQHGTWLNDYEKNQWERKYLDGLVLLGKTRPGLAFLKMAEYYHADKEKSDYFLERALLFDRSKPRAMMLMSVRIKDGTRSYPSMRDRMLAGNKMKQEAADAGYIPAIKSYLKFLKENDRQEEFYFYQKQALDSGDLFSLITIGRHLIHDETAESGKPYIQGMAYLNTYLALAGRDKMEALYTRTKTFYEHESAELPKEVTEEIEALAQALINENSYYVFDKEWELSTFINKQ